MQREKRKIRSYLRQLHGKNSENRKALRLLKLKDHEIREGALILEEVFMRLRRGDENFSCNVEIRKVFGNVRLLISAEGDPFNPLEDLDTLAVDDDEERYRILILASRKRQLAYTRKNSENIVSANLHTEDRQFGLTLAALFSSR